MRSADLGIVPTKGKKRARLVAAESYLSSYALTIAATLTLAIVQMCVVVY